jgi:ABC-type bacteriocin/lantibiotic exporter with double-glycine peptidase domain
LVDIIREAQFPDIDRGTSLAILQQVLERRGIGASGVENPGGSLLAWSHPSILHLKPDVETDGHFVVVLPYSGRGDVTIWDGLDEFRTLPRKILEDQMSGIVLLTAPVPISSYTLRIASLGWDSQNAAFFCVGMLMVAAPALWRARKVSCSPCTEGLDNA